MKHRTTFYIFIQLIKKELISFKKSYFSKLFDTCFLFFTNIMVFCYFMPQEGVREGYASFFLIGAIAGFGFIEIVGKISVFIADIQGHRTIYQSLITPIPSYLVFFAFATYWALTSFLLSIVLFPLGKILLFNQFDLNTISYPRLLLIFITIHFFFGFFALWLASVLKRLSNLNSLWLRYIAPLWMFGAYFFSWHTAYDLNHSVSYILLMDPMVYVMEGMRAATLGPKGYFPFWVSETVLLGFIFICGFFAIKNLKNQLDYV